VIELVAGTSTPIAHADETGIAPTSASVVLRDELGQVVESPVVELPTVSTTIAAGSTALALVVASAAGIVVGRPLAVTSDGVRYLATPSRVDGSTLHLRAALPVAPDLGSSVVDVTMTATLSSVAVARVGAGWQVEWRYASADASRVVTVEAAVVRWPWRRAYSASDVATLLSSVYRSPRTLDFCEQVAERVDAKLRGSIERTGRRPFLFLDASKFREVAEVAARWVLADLGISTIGDPVASSREYRFAFGDELQKVVAGLASYDARNDGSTDPASRRNVVSIRTRR
jgi:hypothetical protein